MIKKIWNKYKSEFKKCLNDLKHKETFYKQIPNLITISRPLGMIPANILFFTGHPVAAFIFTALLLSTDFIDGKLARKWNVVSKFGADLDAVGDKIIFLGMAIPLIVSQPLFLLNIIYEILISTVNIKGRLDELDTKTVYSGKIKTCFLSTTLLAGYLVHFFELPLYIFQTLILGTCITQTFALQEYISNYNQMKKEKNYLENPKEETQEETQTKDKSIGHLKKELLKEKEFLLSSKEPDKEIKNKKRTRKK